MVISGKRVRHGVSKHPLYTVWGKIKDRCYRVKEKAYKNYGAIGVTMWEGWVDNPKAFVEWGINNGWRVGLQIDKDIIPKRVGMAAKIYSPETCCFVTRAENNLAKRTNRIVEYNGKKQTVKEWSVELGLSYSTLSGRLRRTGTIERSKLPRKKVIGNLVQYDGKEKNLSDWGKEYGIGYKLLHERIQRGMSVGDALTTPKNHNRDNITYNGETKNLSRWAKELKISQGTLFKRLYSLNMSVDKAFSMPIQENKRNKKYNNALH